MKYDLLEEHDNKEVDVSVKPFLEDLDADTDQDSDASDDEVTCNPDHLPRRSLATDVAIDELKEKVNNHVDCINLFSNEQKIEELYHQSTTYAEQMSLSEDHITPQNMKIFLSILILSGYNKLPYRRMYWSENPDVFNNWVSKRIRRDTFDKILKSLHFTDNMKMTENRFYKVMTLRCMLTCYN
ncbi:piggyBac transposable element-derived protein 2-like [Palaemon carinicauda]|uniref:piggyBac transposable element-derived protein 2-like n=1 Tax=Palaemon carinicauda TaxID=392227 RepID=UPI0035B571B9